MSLKKTRKKTEFDLQDAASNTLEIEQFFKKAALVETPLTECALREDSLSKEAPALEITSLMKNEIAFLEMDLEGFLGDTNKVLGLLTILLVLFK